MKLSKNTISFYFTKAVVLLFVFIISVEGKTQTVVENAYYSVAAAASFQKSPAFIVTHKASKLQRRIVPQLKLVFTEAQPEMNGAAMDGQPGVVAWKTNKGTTQDINTLGSTDLIADAYQIKNNKLIFNFKDDAASACFCNNKIYRRTTSPCF
jgi:hypothetical protein